MGRSPSPGCHEMSGLRKGPWSQEEDVMLMNYIHKNGHGSWRTLPKRAGLNRCGKSCRLRWNNYLRPDIKRGNFSEEEDQIIIQLHSILGNKWSRIAAELSGRTDNEIKNYWNTHLSKKLFKMGIDPKTHQPLPKVDTIELELNKLLNVQNLTDLIRLYGDGCLMPAQENLASIGQLANASKLIQDNIVMQAISCLNTFPLQVMNGNSHFGTITSSYLQGLLMGNLQANNSVVLHESSSSSLGPNPQMLTGNSSSGSYPSVTDFNLPSLLVDDEDENDTSVMNNQPSDYGDYRNTFFEELDKLLYYKP